MNGGTVSATTVTDTVASINGGAVTGVKSLAIEDDGTNDGLKLT